MDFKHFLESINQNISEAIFRGSKNELVYVNRAYAKMFGFSSEKEAINTNPVNLYKNPDDRYAFIEILLREGKCENQEINLLTKSGEEFIGLVSAVLCEDQEGNEVWDGCIRDITDQKKITAKLLDREQLLNSINKNINEAIYRSVNKGGLIYVNDEFIKMFGYSNDEELMKLNVSDLYKNPEDRIKIGDKIVQKESITNQEVEFKRKDGSTFWGYLNSIKVQGRDGEIFFDGAIRDITKEKEAEKTGKKQAEMQELLIYISSGLINLPIDQIEEATELSLQGLGEFAQADRTYIFEFEQDFSSKEVFSWVKEGIGRIKYGLGNERLHEEIRKFFGGLYSGQYLKIDSIDQMEEGELKKLYKSQKIKTLLSVPLFQDGQCVGCVGFDWVAEEHVISEVEVLLLKLFSEMFMNMRERSTRENELRVLFSKTSEQNQRLRDFSYITSHNFRASVANLMGLLTILEEDRTNQDFFDMTKETALKLNLAIDSINDLLNFEKDISALEKKNCNIKEIVSDILVLNNKAALEKKINFVLDIPEDLTLKVLPAYLQSILHNLIINAMKYGTTPEKRNIFIKAELIGELVLLTVADEGVGIDLKRFGEKLFSLGARFHSNLESGHGMGLYITKQQVEAIGGKIEVESEVNKGTKFKVYLNAKGSKDFVS